MGPQQPIKISDQNEAHLKHSALLKKHFSKMTYETAEIATFQFSHYKSMETENCHSNQSSYLTGTKKNNFFVEANAMQSIRFIKQTVSEKKIFKNFFRKFALFGAQQPIKISDQDEGHLKHSALLNKHLSKNKIQISPMRLQQ